MHAQRQPSLVGSDVLLEVEDVVRVVSMFQCGETSQHLGRVGAAYAGLVFVAEHV
jgi:hypothetical protein